MVGSRHPSTSTVTFEGDLTETHSFNSALLVSILLLLLLLCIYDITLYHISHIKMDPQPTMMNNAAAFQAAGINLAEIWSFPINAGHIPLNDSMLVDQRTNHGGGLARKRREDDESAKGVSTSANALSESDSKRLKANGSNENQECRGDGEGNSGKSAEQPAEPLKDYIHVRARRGQATDSHSLGERARREKISERMKTFQHLVPGCNKVIGKALVPDEIIIMSNHYSARLSSGSKHSTQMPWHLVHKLQGNMLGEHH